MPASPESSTIRQRPGGRGLATVQGGTIPLGCEPSYGSETKWSCTASPWPARGAPLQLASIEYVHVPAG